MEISHCTTPVTHEGIHCFLLKKNSSPPKKKTLMRRLHSITLFGEMCIGFMCIYIFQTLISLQPKMGYDAADRLAPCRIPVRWGEETSQSFQSGSDGLSQKPIKAEVSAGELVDIFHIASGYGHAVFVSEYNASEVQSRSFFSRGYIGFDEKICDEFCIYVRVEMGKGWGFSLESSLFFLGKG